MAPIDEGQLPPETTMVEVLLAPVFHGWTTIDYVVDMLERVERAHHRSVVRCDHCILVGHRQLPRVEDSGRAKSRSRVRRRNVESRPGTRMPRRL
jgi:hypothetical protein